MGVYKKIKRAFSFKKDKKENQRRKSGTSDQLAAGDSLAKGSSEVHVPTNEALQKESKKKSMSLRSIVRKASFGKKDKKKGTTTTTYASNEAALEPVVITPVAAVPQKEKVEMERQSVSIESRELEQTLPLEAEVSVVEAKGDAENEAEKIATEAVKTDESTEQHEPTIEDYLIITADTVKEIEEYGRKLAEDGVKVRINEVDPPTEKEAPLESQAKTEQSAEPHTITDVITLLSDKPVPSADSNEVIDTNKNVDSLPVDGAAIVESKVVPTLKDEVKDATSRVAPEKVNGITNGHTTKTANGKMEPVFVPMSRSSKGQVQDVQIKLWRGWIAAFVVVTSIVAAFMASRRSQLL